MEPEAMFKEQKNIEQDYKLISEQEKILEQINQTNDIQKKVE